ncbi:hypothetical protein LLG95_15010 [bacterium]|nr:hypothetical protein [bacterium]
MPLSSWLSDLIPGIVQAVLEWLWEERGILRYLAGLIIAGLIGFAIWHVVTH